MAMVKDSIPTLDNILAALSGFGRGHFDGRLNASEDPQLNAIIDGINQAAQSLAAQSLQVQENEKLQLAVEKQFAIDILGLGIWKFDPLARTFLWDAGMHGLYDVPVGTGLVAYQAWENSLSPNSAKSAIEDFRLALLSKKPLNTTFQIQLKNGGFRHLAVRAVVVRDAQGEPINMYGVNWDVTKKVLSDTLLHENEQLLSTVLQSLPVAVFGKDIKDDYKWNIWNKKSEELFGVKAQDCIGKSDRDYFPKEQMDKFRAGDIAASQVTGIIEIPEEMAQTPVGPIWLHTRKTVIRDSKGDPKILLGIPENITEQKVKEKRRGEQEAQLNLITDNIPGPIARIDRNGRYVFVSRIYESWFGLPGHQILGKRPVDIISPEFGALAGPFIKRAIAGEKVSFEGPIQLVDGRKPIIQVTLVPCLDIDGQPDGFFTFIHDISSLKEAEAKLVHSSKLASLGEMSAGMAHEINNPLAIISASVELLTIFINDPVKLEHHIEVIRKAGARIAKIVLGLKKFSRSGQKASVVTCSLGEIAKEALILTASKSNRHDTPVTLDCQIDGNINCDEVEIEQVLINLINNAIDAVQNRPEKWVVVSVIAIEDSVVLRVMDSGNGIPEHVRAKLFQPFFTTKPAGRGTGLGLSITKGILDEHKASISVVAECAHTCFEIRFPKAGAKQDSEPQSA